MLNWLNSHGIALIGFAMLALGGVAVALFPSLTGIYGAYSIGVVSISLGQHVLNGFNGYMNQGEVQPINPSTLPPPTVPPNI